MSESKIGYWGKMHCMEEENLKPCRLIWLGPMSKEEMIEEFAEFRHNFRSTPPTTKEEK